MWQKDRRSASLSETLWEADRGSSDGLGNPGRKDTAWTLHYINGHEMDLIKETNTMVVHNPESNMGNACGCPPTMELVHRGS